MFNGIHKLGAPPKCLTLRSTSHTSARDVHDLRVTTCPSSELSEWSYWQMSHLGQNHLSHLLSFMSSHTGKM